MSLLDFVARRFRIRSSLVSRRVAAASFVSCLLASGIASGHVAFEGIARGQRYLADDMVEIQWVDTIPHVTTGYHLSFIPTTDGKPVEIVSDLPPDQHSYVWRVPSEACDECALHVIQDNEGSDYSYSVPIVIVTDPADLVVEEEDMREDTGMHLPPDMAGSAAGGGSGMGGPPMGGAGGAGWAGAPTMGGAWTDMSAAGAASVGGAGTADVLMPPMQGVAAQASNEGVATVPAAGAAAGAGAGAAGAAMQWMAPSTPSSGASCFYASARGTSPRSSLVFAGLLVLGVAVVVRRPKKRLQ